MNTKWVLAVVCITVMITLCEAKKKDKNELNKHRDSSEELKVSKDNKPVKFQKKQKHSNPKNVNIEKKKYKREIPRPEMVVDSQIIETKPKLEKCKREVSEADQKIDQMVEEFEPSEDVQVLENDKMVKKSKTSKKFISGEDQFKSEKKYSKLQKRGTAEKNAKMSGNQLPEV